MMVRRGSEADVPPVILLTRGLLKGASRGVCVSLCVCAGMLPFSRASVPDGARLGESRGANNRRHIVVVV